MTEAANNPTEGERLPWTLTAAALAAMGTLYVTTESFVGLPVLAALLVGAHLTRWRLPAGQAVAMTLRAVAFTAVVMKFGWPEASIRQWYVKPEYTNPLACVFAAELVLRAWSRRDAAKGVEARGIALALSAFVMTLATNTFERAHVQILAPVYAVLVVMFLKSLVGTGVGGGRRRRGAAAMRAGALAAALGMGFGVAQVMRGLDQNVTAWVVHLVQPQRLPPSSIGLSGAPRLAAVYKVDPPMTRVLLIDGSGAERHLRAMAFDTYRARQWEPTLPSRTFQPVRAEDLRMGTGGTWLRFTQLGETMELLAVPLESAAVESGVALDRDSLGSLQRRVAGLVEGYRAVVPAGADFQGPLCVPPDEGQRQRALAVPADLDPKVAELARRVAGDGPPLARVARIIRHLQADHTYGLSYVPAGEPLSDFILNKRSAHCQYFGSALVVMARAAGVPARYVTGYYAHEHNGGDQIVVRERDAHAWAECWIDGTGWVTMDATPSGGLPGDFFGKPSALRKFWERVQDSPRLVREWLARPGNRSKLAMVMTPVGAVVFGGMARRAWRRRKVGPAARQGYAPAGAELAAAGRRFERWLGRRGVVCPAHRTWREHLSAADGKSRIDTAACLRFIDAYEQARFGGANENAPARITELLDGLEYQHHG